MFYRRIDRLIPLESNMAIEKDEKGKLLEDESALSDDFNTIKELNDSGDDLSITDSIKIASRRKCKMIIDESDDD